ncbi:MAG: hypothetical protein Q9167_003334 [Letrouitia subvulpina]
MTDSSALPEKGDQVSWAYGGSHPSGEVAEKKDEGEVAIQSKRGNTITKAAEPDNPAVHVTRPGNDVVKNQDELQVEEKKADGGNGAAIANDAGANDKPAENSDEGLKVPNGDAAAANKGDSRDSALKNSAPKSPKPKKSPAASNKNSPAPQTGKKRKADAIETSPKDADAEPPTEKKARGRPKRAEEEGTPVAAPKEKKPKKEKVEKKEKTEKGVKEQKEVKEGEKKGRGRPKGSGGATTKKDKKAPRPAVNGTVGTRTRSSKK